MAQIKQGFNTRLCLICVHVNTKGPPYYFKFQAKPLSYCPPQRNDVDKVTTMSYFLLVAGKTKRPGPGCSNIASLTISLRGQLAEYFTIL